MRKSFAVPAQVFAHSSKLSLSTDRFKSSSMIEQDLEAIVQLRNQRLKPLFRQMLLQNESCLLLFPEEPGRPEGSPSDQHTINSSIPHTANEIVITVHI